MVINCHVESFDSCSSCWELGLLSNEYLPILIVGRSGSIFRISKIQAS